VSGNDRNGLGETEVRRPLPILWHPPGLSPFDDLQAWFWEQGSRVPAVEGRRAHRAEVLAREPAPIAEARVERAPEENAAAVRDIALANGADLVGIVAPQPEWVFEGYEFDYPWIVMLGVAMDYEVLRKAPEPEASLTVIDGYTRGWEVGQPLADHIRSLGWRAEPRGGPPAGPITLVPAALAAGFGELGKHGSIINRELGSNFRLAAVFTDLPLVSDAPVDIASEDFCSVCRICVDACPPGAISHEKQLVRGVEKWYVDFDLCAPFFMETYGCGVCIAACPWSAPGRGPHISDKMMARRERDAQRNA
jgi:epoxyqueuosine reductase